MIIIITNEFTHTHTSTRLYNQPQGADRVYSGPVDCFAKTYRAEGIRTFIVLYYIILVYYIII
jgi:hypothetical protein